MSGTPETTKKNIYFISNWLFFPKCYLGHPNTTSGKLAEIDSPKIWNIFAQNLKTKKYFVSFSPEKGSSEHPHGHVKCNFDNPGKIFFPEVRIFSRSFRKLDFPQNVPLDTQIALLTNLTGNFRQNLEKFLQKKCEHEEKKFFRENQSSKCSSVDVKNSFDEPAEIFRQNSEKLLLKVQKSKKVLLVFFTKILLPKMFLWTRSSFTTYRKLSAKSWLSFLLIVRKWWGEN